MPSNIATNADRKSALPPHPMGRSGSFPFRTTGSASNRNTSSAYFKSSSGSTPARSTRALESGWPFVEKLWNATEEGFGWNHSTGRDRHFCLRFRRRRGRRNEFENHRNFACGRQSRGCTPDPGSVQRRQRAEQFYRDEGRSGSPRVSAPPKSVREFPTDGSDLA